MSKASLLEKLTDKQYRDAFVSDEIDVGLPMQLRLMREARGWKQSYVAEKTGTKQPRFSLMEKAGYGSFSLNTLKKLAALFDVGLIVSFVPFSEMIEFVEGMGPKRLSAPSFVEQYPQLLKRYSRPVREETYTPQASLDFVGATAKAEDFDSGASISVPPETAATTQSNDPEPSVKDSPVPYFVVKSAEVEMYAGQ